MVDLIKIFDMRKIIVAVFSIFLVSVVVAQRPNPVHWNFEAVKKADKQYDIIATASIDAPWHIYSQFVKGGPIPTNFQFKPNPLIVLNGKTKEMGKLEKNFDKNFNAVIATFGGKVQFIQPITLKVSSKTKLTGTLEYTACNDEKCLPPVKLPFEVDIQ
jgi:thiol:disulfide interchange protein DsbD